MLVTRAKGAKVGKAELKVNKTIRVPLDLNIEVQMVRQGCLWMKQIPRWQTNFKGKDGYDGEANQYELTGASKLRRLKKHGSEHSDFYSTRQHRCW